MKAGDLIETGLCRHCKRRVQHTYWADGGTLWTHASDNRTACSRTPRADPLPESVTPVSGNQP